MEVIEPPSVAEHLTARWEIPPVQVKLFETLAKYGSPWRLMDGGRHDFPVVEDGDDVLVGFSAAHDYAVLDNDGKTLPPFGEWTHRMYARVLLADGVKQLKKTRGSEN
ncbi:hypothetical protein BDZ89DRAFT_1257838 [Hymenopellis radicata]|nr:hypothetical protein BDZ89DRAFT_1257838 [Hymenopellis radicata]